MRSPLEDFQNLVPQRNVGETHVYHFGSLAQDAATSPALATVQMLANGLQLMGRVELRQKRFKMGSGNYMTEYQLRILQPVGKKDFDTARKAYLTSVELE